MLALRNVMRESGLAETPIIMAGGVWWLEEWEHWIDRIRDSARSPSSSARCWPAAPRGKPDRRPWKRKLPTLKEEAHDLLNRFSPTGFYSSAVNNAFIMELRERNERQVAYTAERVGEHLAEFGVGPRKRTVYLTPPDFARVTEWEAHGFTEALRTPTVR